MRTATLSNLYQITIVAGLWFFNLSMLAKRKRRLHFEGASGNISEYFGMLTQNPVRQINKFESGHYYALRPWEAYQTFRTYTYSVEEDRKSPCRMQCQ